MNRELRVGSVPVEVVLKDILHMHLYVLPPDGRVRVTAPLNATEKAALAFVRENFGWVLKQREGMKEQRRQPPRQYVSGETHYVWGKQYFLDVRSQRAWGTISLSGDMMTLFAPVVSTVASRREYADAWYRELLKEELSRQLPKWEKRVGCRVKRFEIKNMSSSWGKCSPDTGRVVFNLKLAHNSKEALSYVILHELCHFKFRNHGKEFVALLDRHMPDWREVRARLNAAPL